MGFFSAVGQVISNQKNFRQWEKEDADKQKQREALAKNGIDSAELQKAANKGKVIMDVIDIMDTHSEEVAENTETAIMPIAQSFPALVSLLTMFGTIKFYLMPKSNAYDKALQGFMNSDAGIETKNIVEKLRDNIKTQPKNGPLDKIKLSEVDLMTNITGRKLRDIENLDSKNYSLTTIFNKKNMEILSKSTDKDIKPLYSRLGELSKEFNNTKGIKNFSIGKTAGKTALLISGISAAVFVAANIIAAKIQVKSSRIARWQSREDLKDPKYFVQYTDEQVEEAKKKIHTDKEENTGFSPFKNKDQKGVMKYSDNNSFFKSLGAIIKDNKQYEEWKQNYNLEDKKVKRNLSEKEIEEAQKEQEVIQRITKTINNSAEEYSENMETAAGLLIGGTPFLGIGIGAIINTIMTKTGLGEKISLNQFNKIIKNIPDENKKDELTKLYKSLKPAKDTNAKGFVANMSNKISEVKNFGSYYVNAMEGLMSNGPDKGAVSEAIESFKNMFKIAGTTKFGRNGMIAVAGSMITGMAGSFIGLKLQKSAARAGRFKAKRELEENSTNFIGYTKNDFNSVSNIKADKKPLLKKFGEYITFLPRVIKDYYKYEDYRKNEADYDKKLLHELTKVEVTDKQMQEAKELQRKIFTTFESVDDKSQEYSEAIEAITEMIQPQLPHIGMLVVLLPFVIGGAKLAKGGAPKAAESITGFLAKHTQFLKGKTVNKYVDSVSENIKGIVEKQDVSASAPFAKISALLSGTEDSEKMAGALQNALKSAKGKDNELEAFLKALADDSLLKKPINKDELDKILDTYNETLNSYIETVSKLMGLSGEEKINLDVKKMIEPYIGNAASPSDVLNKLVKENDIPNIKITNMNSVFGSFTKEIDGLKDELNNALKSNNITGVANAVIEGKLQTGEWRKLLSQMEETMPDGALKNALGALSNSSIADEQALKIYQNINTILKNMPKEELSKIMDTAVEEFKKNPDKFIKALQTGQLKAVFLTKGIAITAIATPVAWNALSAIMTFTVVSTFASMQKQAGRLGVMKAFEELEDYKFYANMEAQNSDNASFASKTNSSAQNLMKNKINNSVFNRFIQK